MGMIQEMNVAQTQPDGYLTIPTAGKGRGALVVTVGGVLASRNFGSVEQPPAQKIGGGPCLSAGPVFFGQIGLARLTDRVLRGALGGGR